MIREVPILFNTEMVLATLENYKTATRRLIRPRYQKNESGFEVAKNKGTGQRWVYTVDDEGFMRREIVPPCRPDDILYVRETWRVNNLFSEDDEKFYIVFEYKADGSYTTVEVSEEIYEKYEYSMAENSPEWRPSIHMPKMAARLWLKVKDVRVERLQDMNADDLKAEGFLKYSLNDFKSEFDKLAVKFEYEDAQKRFAALWDSTLPRGQQDLYSWEADPWVWAIEFERCRKLETED